MNALGGPCLLLVLVLIATLSTLPALGWIGTPASPGTDGVYNEDSRFELPAVDGLIPLFSSVVVPLLVRPAPVALLGARDTASCATRTLAPRGPPSG